MTFQIIRIYQAYTFCLNKFPDFYVRFMDSETKKDFGDNDRIYILFKKEKELNKILDSKLAA